MTGPIRVLELRSVRGTGGGPEKTILHGALQVDPAHTRVSVCYIRDARDPVFGIGDWAARLGVDYTEIRERHSFDPSIWRSLTSLVKRLGIRIVHSHDYKTNFLALLLARAARVIPVSTEHGWTGHSWRERALYYPADKRLARFFPCVVAVSTDIRNELVRHGARPDRVVTILNGIDPSAFNRDASRRDRVRSSLGVAPADIVIGSVGRLEVQKRFDLLLEAVAELRGRDARVRVVIVGDGSERAALESVRERLTLGEYGMLLGHRTDVGDLHNAFDLFVQSSDYEGTPNTVLEAMALETPIVATDAGGTSELVVDGIHGRIVPPGSSRILAAAIQSVLDDPAATAARTKAARQRIEQQLSFQARTRRLETIYASVMAER